MRVEVRKAGDLLTIELFTSTELVVRVSSGQDQTTVFQKIVSYEALDPDVKFLFQNIKDLYEALAALAADDSNDSCLIEANGKIHFQLQLKCLQKVITKRLTFHLDKALSCDQEVLVLRASLNAARVEIAELREGVMRLSEENLQLRAKFVQLEQLVEAKLSGRQEYTLSKPIQEYEKVEESLRPQKSESVEEPITEQCLKVRPLEVVIDEKCLHYDKFVIAGNRIASLHEDYYQIYSSRPLPRRGVYSVRVRMAAQNHMSVGLIARSALNNQYSFQNNKTVCFYSYFYGNFRGIYFRSKYEPLNWPMEVGEVILLQIDLNAQLLRIGAEGRPTTEIVNFKSLYEEQPLYFFLEMYEKDNAVELLQ